MRKKILLSLVFIVFAAVIVFAVLLKKNQTEDETENSLGEGEVIQAVEFHEDDEKRFAIKGSLTVYDDYYNNIHLDVRLEQGAVLLTVYDWEFVSGEEPQNPVLSEQIAESGSYDFSMDEFHAGEYWVEVTEVKTDDKSCVTIGRVDYTASNYKKHGSKFLDN